MGSLSQVPQWKNGATFLMGLPVDRQTDYPPHPPAIARGRFHPLAIALPCPALASLAPQVGVVISPIVNTESLHDIPPTIAKAYRNAVCVAFSVDTVPRCTVGNATPHNAVASHDEFSNRVAVVDEC